MTNDVSYSGLIRSLEPTAQRISQQLLGSAGGELIRLGHEEAAKIRGPLQRRAIHQGPVWIDGRGTILVAPTAQQIEVLQRKTDRIHDLVARRARLVRTMLLQPLPH